MHYDDFLKAILWQKAEWAKIKHAPELGCQKYQDFSYAALRKRGDDYWLHLENMNQTDLEAEIIDCFLNTKRWYVHLPDPKDPLRPQLVSNLEKAVGQLPAYYAALEDLRIEDVNFQQSNLLFLIDCTYSVFRQIKPKFGAVPASKLMHMALPHLFVMWDDKIIKEYGIKKQVLPYFERRVWSYTAFLILMQENIHHIKATNPTGPSIMNEELFRQINAQIGENGLPMTRLLDIANTAVSRKRRLFPKCRKCIDAARLRLNTMPWYDHRFKPKKPFFDC